MENSFFARTCLISGIIITLLSAVDYQISFFGLQWHYFILRPFIIFSFFLLSYLSSKKTVIPLYYYDLYSLLLYALAFYGMVFIGPPYTFCFMHIFIAIGITTQTTTKRFFIQSIIGFFICLLAHYLTPQPRIVDPTAPIKPLLFLVAFIFQVISGVIYVFVTRYRVEINKLNEQYALIGKKSSFLIHEIKSPLTRVYGQTQSVEGKEILTSINNEARKILSIIESVETLIYRPHHLHETFTKFSLKDIKDEVEKEFSEYLRAMNIKLHFDHLDTSIEGNINLIYQLFKNIIDNAIEAIGHQSGSIPLIQISAKNLENKVIISIRNTHSYITKKTLNKIFLPHFSTKENIRNKGLGLSLATSIVKAHQGEIKAYSDKDFTEFLITLNTSTEYVHT